MARARRDWTVIPQGRLLTLQQAAEFLQVTRKLLVSEYVSGRRPTPADVEYIRHDGQTMIYRHSGRG